MLRRFNRSEEDFASAEEKSSRDNPVISDFFPRGNSPGGEQDCCLDPPPFSLPECLLVPFG